MILQQESNVNFWGKAQKNQELLIYTSWSGNIHKTTVNNDGNWKIKIKTPSAGGPFNIQITCNSETKTIIRDIFFNDILFNFYHLIIELPQVNPLPKAAKTTISPEFIFPSSQASVNAIGIDPAVVFPYF